MKKINLFLSVCLGVFVLVSVLSIQNYNSLSNYIEVGASKLQRMNAFEPMLFQTFDGWML